MSDDNNKKPFSIVPPPIVPEEEPSLVDAVREQSPPELEPDIKTPIERLIQKELNTDRFMLAYYDADGNVGFYIGDGLEPEAVSFVTDVVKAQVMMQLLLE